MSYKKGQLLTYEYPMQKTYNIRKTKTIVEFHRVVVLHQRQTPYQTVLIAPITKALSLSSTSKIPSNYIQLKQADYPFFLDVDSYINLDMISAVDSCELKELVKGASRTIITGTLTEQDLFDLDLKLVITYELDKFIEREVSAEINDEISSLIEYIDVDIKDKIKELILKVNNYELLKDIFEIIDCLVNEIKLNYKK